MSNGVASMTDRELDFVLGELSKGTYTYLVYGSNGCDRCYPTLEMAKLDPEFATSKVVKTWRYCPYFSVHESEIHMYIKYSLTNRQREDLFRLIYETHIHLSPEDIPGELLTMSPRTLTEYVIRVLNHSQAS